MKEQLDKKTYSKTYYFDKEHKDSLAIKWQTGLKAFYIYHNNSLIGEFDHPKAFFNWKEIEVPNKGNLKVRFYSRLMDFEVKFGDYYLENSYIHSKKKLWTVFVIFAVFALLSCGVGILLALKTTTPAPQLDLNHYTVTFLKALLYSLACVFMFTKFNLVFYSIGVLTYLWVVLPDLYDLIATMTSISLSTFGFFELFSLLFFVGIAVLFMLVFINYFQAVKDYNKYLTSHQ